MSDKPTFEEEWSEVTLYLDCPLPDRDCDLTPGKTQDEHAEFCDQEMEYRLGDSHLVFADWSDCKSGDELKMIDKRAYAAAIAERDAALSELKHAKHMRDFIEANRDQLRLDKVQALEEVERRTNASAFLQAANYLLKEAERGGGGVRGWMFMIEWIYVVALCTAIAFSVGSFLGFAAGSKFDPSEGAKRGYTINIDREIHHCVRLER